MAGAQLLPDPCDLGNHATDSAILANQVSGVTVGAALIE